jgi:mRNA-degrading endonuclease RelE of RelBE toxin-antitoxin system
MSDKVKKFLRKLQPKQRDQILKALDKLAKDDLKGLDVKPLSGHDGWHRCRVGKIRIIFVRTGTGKNVVYAIDFRGGIYKGL